MDNKPFSEQFRLASKDWVDKDSAARLLEETKTAVLAQMKARQGDMPDNAAERIVKSSPEWFEWVEGMVKARTAANLAKARLEYVRMKYWEHQSANATARSEMRMG